MTRQEPAALPDDHRRLPPVWMGRTDGGIDFEVRSGTSQRRAGGGTLMRNVINAQARGRPVGHADLYEKVPELYLVVRGMPRTDIRILPNGAYSIGAGRPVRGLRKLVEGFLEVVDARRRPSAEPTEGKEMKP